MPTPTSVLFNFLSLVSGVCLVLSLTYNTTYQEVSNDVHHQYVIIIEWILMMFFALMQILFETNSSQHPIQGLEAKTTYSTQPLIV